MGDPITGDSDNKEVEGEEHDQLDFAFLAHLAPYDDGYGEEDEQQVRDDVADSHGDELRIPLPTLSSRIREDLPIMRKRPAFHQITDDDGKEGGPQDAPEDHERQLVGPLPADVEPLEELEDG